VSKSGGRPGAEVPFLRRGSRSVRLMALCTKHTFFFGSGPKPAIISAGMSYVPLHQCEDRAAQFRSVRSVTYLAARKLNSHVRFAIQALKS